MPVLLNERLYKYKKAIRLLAPLPPSGDVITLRIGYCIYFLIFHFTPSVRLSFHLSLPPCMHAISILTLNGISFQEIRYQPSCPLLFQARREDSSYDPDTALSPHSFTFFFHLFSLSNPLSLSLLSSFLPLPLSLSPPRPNLLSCSNYHLH